MLMVRPLDEEFWVGAMEMRIILRRNCHEELDSMARSSYLERPGWSSELRGQRRLGVGLHGWRRRRNGWRDRRLGGDGLLCKGRQGQLGRERWASQTRGCAAGGGAARVGTAGAV